MNESTEKPSEEITAANCYKTAHPEVRIGQSNLVKCALCGRIRFQEFPELGARLKQ